MSFIEKKNIRYKVRYLDFLRFEKGKSIFAAIINRKRFKLFGFFFNYATEPILPS